MLCFERATGAAGVQVANLSAHEQQGPSQHAYGVPWMPGEAAP